MSFTQKLAIIGISLLPTGALADWNGWYGGVSTGELSNGAFNPEGFDNSDIEDTSTFGGFLGKMTRNGDFAFGGEIALLFADEPPLSSDRDEVLADPIFDMKGRAGYIIGDLMPYAVVGLSSMRIDGPITEVTGSGFSFGAGIEYQIADQFLIGVEYLTRRTTGEFETSNGFFDVTRDLEVDAGTVSLRVGYKF